MVGWVYEEPQGWKGDIEERGEIDWWIDDNRMVARKKECLNKRERQDTKVNVEKLVDC